MDRDQLERNKQVVSRFVGIVEGPGDNLHLLDEVVAEEYIQHNPNIGQGREGVRRFFEELVPLPRVDHREVNLIAEGDFVVRQDIRPNGMLIDIWRIEDGRLQEHWDAYRANPGTEPLPGF